MKRIIFFSLFLLSVPAVRAEDFRGKFMLSLKAGHAYLLDNQVERQKLFGSRIDYFIRDWISIGLDLNYLEYNEDVSLRFADSYGVESELGPKWKWYSFVFSGKLSLDTTRFSPFLKAGFGFYVPRVIYKLYPTSYESIEPITVKLNGRTCPGYNLGMGFQYRMWKGLSLQIEGTIDYIYNKARQISPVHSFTFANVNAGMSIVF